MTPVRRATAFAFAGILALASVVACLAAAFALARILSLARMRILRRCHRLEGDACFAISRANGVRRDGHGTSHESGHGRAGNQCFRCLDHTSFLFVFLFSAHPKAA
jgi:hypothetical protein